MKSQVAPLEYLRHVTMDLGFVEGMGADPSGNHLGVNALIDRFNEVSLFPTHVICRKRDDEICDCEFSNLPFCSPFCL